MVGSGLGAGAGFGAVGLVGVVGVVGVVGCGGATGVPGSWMSSRVLPGGTSTVTGMISPLGSCTYTVWV